MTPVAQPESQTPRSHSRVSVFDISPRPRANSSGIRKHKSESASVITSSPYKALLESKKQKPVRSRGAASKCSVEDSKKSRKTEKTETKVRQERHSGQKKSRTNAVFPCSLGSRMPLPHHITDYSLSIFRFRNTKSDLQNYVLAQS